MIYRRLFVLPSLRRNTSSLANLIIVSRSHSDDRPTSTHALLFAQEVVHIERVKDNFETKTWFRLLARFLSRLSPHPIDLNGHLPQSRRLPAASEGADLPQLPYFL